MRKLVMRLGVAAALVVGLWALSPLHADETNHLLELGIGSSMMKGGMMRMMQGMSGMMASCSNMMNGGESASRPNDQWQKKAPGTPEEK
jgi:hypothetical protein